MHAAAAIALLFATNASHHVTVQHQPGQITYLLMGSYTLRSSHPANATAIRLRNAAAKYYAKGRYRAAAQAYIQATAAIQRAFGPARTGYAAKEMGVLCYNAGVAYVMAKRRIAKTPLPQIAATSPRCRASLRLVLKLEPP